MPTGDKNKIQEDARIMIEKLGSEKGGFMAKDYPQWEDVGVKEEWARWARDAFVEYGTLS
jgi:hypothetical protein